MSRASFLLFLPLPAGRVAGFFSQELALGSISVNVKRIPEGLSERGRP